MCFNSTKNIQTITVNPDLKSPHFIPEILQLWRRVLISCARFQQRTITCSSDPSKPIREVGKWYWEFVYLKINNHGVLSGASFYLTDRRNFTEYPQTPSGEKAAFILRYLEGVFAFFCTKLSSNSTEVSELLKLLINGLAADVCMWIYEYILCFQNQVQAVSQVKPNHSELPLVAGCSRGHRSLIQCFQCF